MRSDFERKATDVFLKLSDVYLDEKIEVDNALGEKILGKAVINRVVNIVYRNLKNNSGLRDFGAAYKAIYNMNMELAKKCKKNIETICGIMEEADFPYALLKGAYLLTHLYEEGDRTSNDVDILVSEQNVGKCKELLVKHGFVQGWILDDKFIKAKRSDIIMSKMNYGETIPFIKETEYGFIKADVNFSFDYKPMEDESILLEMLSRTIRLPYRETVIQTLDEADFIIHLCLHLYKEATTSEWVFRRKDLNLYKFNDLYLLMKNIETPNLFENLIERVNRYGVNKQCYYAFLNAATIFEKMNGIDGFNQMLDSIKPTELGYLKQIINPRENVIYDYGMDFRDWLACEDRKKYLLENCNKEN